MLAHLVQHSGEGRQAAEAVERVHVHLEALGEAALRCREAVQEQSAAQGAVQAAGGQACGGRRAATARLRGLLATS